MARRVAMVGALLALGLGLGCGNEEPTTPTPIPTPIPQTTTITKVFETRDLGFIYQPAFAGDYLFAAGVDGLFVLNVATPTAPVVVQTIPADRTRGEESRPFTGVFVDGQYVYVTYGGRDSPIGGLRIYQRDPTRQLPLDPNPVGSIALPRGPISVWVSGDIAYVGGYASGAFLIDVSQKNAPKILSNLKLGKDQFHSYEEILSRHLARLNLPNETALFAYMRATYPDILAGWTDNDIRAFLTEQGLVGHAWWMKPYGNTLYLPYDGEGMYTVDVSNKRAPAVLGRFNRICFGESERCYFNDVSVIGNYALVAIDFGGLLVLDISNPANVREVALVRPWPKETWATALGHTVQIKVSGTAAFVTAYEDGVHVYDVSNPSLPILLQKESSGSDSVGKGCSWGLDVTSSLLAVGYAPCVTDYHIAGALELYRISSR